MYPLKRYKSDADHIDNSSISTKNNLSALNRTVQSFRLPDDNSLLSSTANQFSGASNLQNSSRNRTGSIIEEPYVRHTSNISKRSSILSPSLEWVLKTPQTVQKYTGTKKKTT